MTMATTARAVAVRIRARRCRTGCRSWCWRRASPLILLFVYGFIPLPPCCPSPARSCCPTSATWVGLRQLCAPVQPPELDRPSLTNLAIFASLYIVICSVLGLGLAILLDQKIRGEGVLRPIYLYPMALSFIVTGVAWKWFLDPGHRPRARHARLGLGELFLPLDQGQARWRSTPSSSPPSGSPRASSWRCSWPACAASTTRSSRRRRSTAPSTFTIYRRIIIPLMRPVFLSAFVVLAHLAIKSYDLVVALTDGGPGTATWTAGALHVEVHLRPQRDGRSARRRR